MKNIFAGRLARCLALFSVCLLPPAAPLLAADELHDIQLTPFAGYRFGGSFEDKDTEQDYDLDDGQSFGFLLNFPASQYTEWEIYYSRQSTDVDVAGFVETSARLDMDVEYLQVGGTYLIDETEKLKPYFVATAGVAKLTPDAAGTDSDTFFSFGVGGGWKYFPTRHLGLRFDGRLLGTFISSDSKIFCKSDAAGGGCVINVTGDSLYQFELQAGVIFRF